MPRSKRKWKPSERQMVIDMAARKATYVDIAKALLTSVPTLKRYFKAELAGNQRRPGSTPDEWTTEERKVILQMASYGIPYEEIALCYGVDRGTLVEHFGEELETAETKWKANIARSLTLNALRGNVSAQIFIAKTRLRWSERVTVAHEGSIETNAAKDVDLEAALSSLSPEGRDGLRALLSSADPETQGDAPPESKRLH